MSLAFARPRAFLPVPVLILLAALTPVQAQQEAPPRLDVPYVPTPQPVVDRMLEMADVQPGDYLIDLGSGDGRIAISAVRDRGADAALGVDLNPERIREAEQNAEAAGVSDKVTFEQGDLFQKDISEASVLTMYLLPRVNLRLRPVILDTLAPGTRVVSHAFSMDDWPADRTDYVSGSYVYLWIVPAKVAGRWQVDVDGEQFTLELEQQYQEVSGTAETAAARHPVDASLVGDELRFSIAGRQYVGRVDGDRIEAVSAEGAVSGWSARRS